MTSKVQKSEDNEIDDFVIVPSTFLTPQWQAQALNNPPKESVNIQKHGTNLRKLGPTAWSNSQCPMEHRRLKLKRMRDANWQTPTPVNLKAKQHKDSKTYEDITKEDILQQLAQTFAPTTASIPAKHTRPKKKKPQPPPKPIFIPSRRKRFFSTLQIFIWKK